MLRFLFGTILGLIVVAGALVAWTVAVPPKGGPLTVAQGDPGAPPAVVAAPAEDADATPPAEPEPEPVVAAPTEPEVAPVAPAAEPEAEEVAETAPAAPVPGTDTAAVETPAADASADASAVVRGDAFERNAVAFERRDSRPLIAIVFDDASAGDLPLTQMIETPVPVALSISPSGAGTREFAVEAHAAGKEILIRLANAAPDAAEVGTLADRFDMAIGVTRPPQRSNPSIIAAERAAAPTLAEKGLAFIDSVRGSSFATEDTFRGAGIPFARNAQTISPAASIEEARAILEYATADANRDGAAIVFSAATEAAYIALGQWSVDQQRQTRPVRLAPLSAVIRELSPAPESGG